MPTLWTRLRAAADPITRQLGFYTAYPLTEHEYVGEADLSVSGAIHYLRQNAYRAQLLSAAKRHPNTNRLHDLSYRRVPNQHPADAAGSELVERFDPSECQLHVHGFERDGRLEFYSHYETRPDFWNPSISFTRLRTHYHPTYGATYLRGITDLDI